MFPQKHSRHHISNDRDRGGPVVPLRPVELHPARAAVVPQPQEDPGQEVEQQQEIQACC